MDFIVSFTDQNGFAPSLEEIKKHSHLKAVSTVHQYIESLYKKGFISKENHTPRSIIASLREIEIPLLGYIAAGEPIEAIANPESIKVPQTMLPQTGFHYALKVKGDSMIDEGISNGDTVVIKRQETAENGQKVVALLNGNEATLKTFYNENGQIRLQPANKNYQPIIIKKGITPKILGIVFDIVVCQ